ncbi:MAG: methyltransferase domain-containing protein [Actinomycetota bacterium]|nr:methyltransferase domain-containing protein [Actinomycetota bacterium]
MNDWTDRAAALADELVKKGKLRSPEWIAAVRAVPRHELVPVFYEQDPASGQWLRRESTDPQWQEGIYANRALFTMIGEETGSWGTAVVGLSSTSTPGLITRMLETLDIRDGHDVLEIGTGTGYNAALLTHRLGDRHVFSVDIERNLVDSARERLAALGYRPTLMAADGAHGLPERAPYDRIIATCSVPAIPWAWVEQTRVGGLILTDLKLAIHAGNLVRLHRGSDRAEGRFDPTWAGFMPLRPGTPSHERTLPVRDRNRAARRTTNLDQPRPWDNMVAWFLAQLSVPTEIGYGHTLDEHTGRPGDVFLTSSDGSWCEVSEHAGQVWEVGPTRLWAAVEDAHRRWHELGEPTWDRFGLTATPNRQWVWLDAPDGDHSWPLRTLP